MEFTTLITSMANFSSPPSSYRGRLAPSPTGFLHVGHARTFWTAFERARRAGGTLVMRMEDLDPERSRAEYAEAALEDLRWLGIRWQEGPDLNGPCAPYEQSARRAIYLDAWRKLLRGGFLFPCHCSRKDLEAALSAPHESASGKSEPLDDEPIYPGTCRTQAFAIKELDSPCNLSRCVAQAASRRIFVSLPLLTQGSGGRAQRAARKRERKSGALG